MTTPAELPKTIYSLWIQGRDAAPALVQNNWERWERLNPDFDLVILDRDSALPHLTDFPIDLDSLSPQTFSDVLRLTLLARYGGVWVDAAAFPTRPLSSWLTSAVKKSGFFAYTRRAEHPTPLSIWFLAAEPNALIVQKWLDLKRAYWFMERTLDETKPLHYSPKNPSEAMRLYDLSPTPHYPYFCTHHIFDHLLKTDAEFAARWAKTQRLSSEDAHAVQYMLASTRLFKRWQRERGLIGRVKKARLQTYLANTPVHKLNWRSKYPIALLNRLADKALIS